MDRLKLGSLREETLKMLYDLYDGFYIKTYNLVKKNDLHYANSDQEFELFLNFLKDHDMSNYAAFLSDFEKDRSVFVEFEFEKEKVDCYQKYFNPQSEFFLHLKMDLQYDEEGNTRNLGDISI